MTELLATIMGMTAITAVYYLFYKDFKVDGKQDAEQFKISKAVLNNLSLFFQQMVILNSINIVSLLVVYFNELGTLPNTLSFVKNYFVIFSTINYVYFTIIFIYILASGFEFLRKISVFKKKGGMIKW